MRKQLTRIVAPIVAAVLVAAVQAWAESPDDILIIANKSVESASVDMKTAKAIFLKERLAWRGGAKVNAINAKEGTELRKQFRDRVLKMSVQNEVRYWQNQKMIKGVTPPPEFKQTTRAVFSVAGAVSYVFRKDYQGDTAKILLVVPKQ